MGPYRLSSFASRAAANVVSCCAASTAGTNASASQRTITRIKTPSPGVGSPPGLVTLEPAWLRKTTNGHVGVRRCAGVQLDYEPMCAGPVRVARTGRLRLGAGRSSAAVLEAVRVERRCRVDRIRANIDIDIGRGRAIPVR